MPRRPPPRSDLPPEIADLIAAMDVGQLRTAMTGALDVAAARARRSTVPERTSRRRPRSDASSSVTVRIDLDRAEPPVWRRVVLPSTLHLDQLHALLQELFGWTDSHLHRFTQGASPWDRDVEVFLCPLDVEEGEDEGPPASEVRLDEVLHEPGDRLVYVYDYGDDWTLVLSVEEVTATPSERPRCTGGGGVSPPEDSGGVAAWNDAPDRDGETSFDAAALDERVAAWWAEQQLPPALLELRRQLAWTPGSAVLRDLLADADLVGGPVSVDELEATEVVRHYAWLLDTVGDGLPLTGAGWLPPAVVSAAATELGADRSWPGKHNREDRTPPVRALRSSAQRLGLLRVSKGVLLRTRTGAALREDAVGLWRHVADRTAGAPREPFARVATSLLLLSVAAGRPDDTDLGALLAQAGWRTGEREPPSRWRVRAAAEQARAVLDATGALGDRGARWTGDPVRPTPAGRVLARAALTSLVR